MAATQESRQIGGEVGSLRFRSSGQGPVQTHWNQQALAAPVPISQGCKSALHPLSPQSHACPGAVIIGRACIASEGAQDRRQHHHGPDGPDVQSSVRNREAVPLHRGSRCDTGSTPSRVEALLTAVAASKRPRHGITGMAPTELIDWTWIMPPALCGGTTRSTTAPQHPNGRLWLSGCLCRAEGARIETRRDLSSREGSKLTPHTQGVP
ncbi:hypothetical protein EDB80DRAFT_814942 [Ilyonectria destructans]|nr:hypothetical protein EDB80DRAFT_814942 [Ilyonectria destructans]